MANIVAGVQLGSDTNDRPDAKSLRDTHERAQL